ncbi:hypothetical protein KP509_26G003500 [Ceratopteris richardii]|uniref:Uncharacterized protein n=1 Tax=Ceratopteris richardii TaxID=49495 RepID=A0A8T2RKE0_CERRI|nr:hypothetical protein KP509_26G003500 [Ceratopteris richardii]
MAVETETLADFLWNQSSDLLDLARQTVFIKGVRDGILDPDFYGTYMLQDGWYCREVGGIWREVSTSNREGVDSEIKNFAAESGVKYERYGNAIYDRWNAIEIKAGKDIMKYVDSIKTSVTEYAPNILISTYACVKLWPVLTGELDNVVKEGNPYKVWVDANQSSGKTEKAQAHLINSHKGFHRENALDMFRIAMQNEIDFFNGGGKA